MMVRFMKGNSARKEGKAMVALTPKEFAAKAKKEAKAKVKAEAKAKAKAKAIAERVIERGRSHTGLFTKPSAWWKALMSAEMTPYHPNEDFAGMVKHTYKKVMKETKAHMIDEYNFRMRKENPVGRTILITLLSNYIYYVYEQGPVMQKALNALEDLPYDRLEYYANKFKRLDDSIEDVFAYHRQRLYGDKDNARHK